MKILWVSNYLTHSAYAIQSRLFVPHLRELGHEVFVLPIGSANIITVTDLSDGTPVLPLTKDAMGNDIVFHHYRNIQADCVISFTDIWALDPAVYEQMNWFPIVPIDCIPHDQTKMVLAVAKGAAAISDYGKALIEAEMNGKPICYLPMMVGDHWIPGHKQLARDTRGFPQDKFLAVFVGANDSNPSRKGIPELLLAWHDYVATNPDSLLYLHTNCQGNRAQHGVIGGVDIIAIIDTLPNLSGENVKFPVVSEYDLGWPLEQMVHLAQAADVLIIPSRREGACLPLLEFQACGCPVIATDAHAQAEHVYMGRTVKAQPEWALHGSWDYVANVPAIVKALQYVKGNDFTLNTLPSAFGKHRPEVARGFLRAFLEEITVTLLEGMTDGQKQQNSP